MEIAKRIQHIIDEHGLTASAFADRIGIQRSGLSHIFSGRNKPSLDLVMKIIEEFPGVRVEWLLWGKEPMTVSAATGSDTPSVDTGVNNKKKRSTPKDKITGVTSPKENREESSVFTDVTTGEKITQEAGEAKEATEPDKMAEEHLAAQKAQVAPGGQRTEGEHPADIKGVIVLHKNGTFSHYSPE